MIDNTPAASSHPFNSNYDQFVCSWNNNDHATAHDTSQHHHTLGQKDHQQQPQAPLCVQQHAHSAGLTAPESIPSNHHQQQQQQLQQQDPQLTVCNSIFANSPSWISELAANAFNEQNFSNDSINFFDSNSNNSIDHFSQHLLNSSLENVPDSSILDHGSYRSSPTDQSLKNVHIIAAAGAGSSSTGTDKLLPSTGLSPLGDEFYSTASCGGKDLWTGGGGHSHNSPKSLSLGSHGSSSGEELLLNAFGSAGAAHSVTSSNSHHGNTSRRKSDGNGNLMLGSSKKEGLMGSADSQQASSGQGTGGGAAPRRHRRPSMGGGASKRHNDLSPSSSTSWGTNNNRRNSASIGNNCNKSFSSSLSKFTLPDENGKRKIRHDIMSIAESLPALPGLYFDKKQKGFRVRYQNVYVGWVALSRFPSIEEAYCSARDIWENAKAHAEKFQTPHAAVMASLPLQKEAQASGKNRGGRPRTVTQLPPNTADWLATAYCSQSAPPGSAAATTWGAPRGALHHHPHAITQTDPNHQNRTDPLGAAAAAAWNSVANELAVRAANGTLDFHALQLAGMSDGDILESLQESQWTPPPGYSSSGSILTPASTKASETSPPLSSPPSYGILKGQNGLYMGLMGGDTSGANCCYRRPMDGGHKLGGMNAPSAYMPSTGGTTGAISYSKPVMDDSAAYEEMAHDPMLGDRTGCGDVHLGHEDQLASHQSLLASAGASAAGSAAASSSPSVSSMMLAEHTNTRRLEDDDDMSNQTHAINMLGDNFTSLSGTLAACDDPALSTVWDMGAGRMDDSNHQQHMAAASSPTQ